MKFTISVLLVGLFFCLVPPLSFAAEGAEGGWGWIETIGRWFNLLVVFGAIFFFTREPIRRFFSERKAGISAEIVQAKAAQEEAERALARMEEQMQQLEQELEELRREAEAEAQREKMRILAEAEVEGEKISASMQRQIEGLTKAARQDLRAYAAELALDLAKGKIETELDGRTRERVIDRFLVRLGTREDGSSE